MATLNFEGGFVMKSALAVDLALIKLDIAAIRSDQGMNLDDETYEAVRLIKDTISRELNMANSRAQISEKLVPEQDKRELLQKSLTSISASKQRFDPADFGFLKQFVELLSELADSRRCEARQAEKLHSFLRKLDKRPTTTSLRNKFPVLFR